MPDDSTITLMGDVTPTKIVPIEVSIIYHTIRLLYVI